VKGDLELDGIPVGWALPDGWKLAEEELEINGMRQYPKLGTFVLDRDWIDL
jgi:hypothetical protein